MGKLLGDNVTFTYTAVYLFVYPNFIYNFNFLSLSLLWHDLL